ncbi:hypothetical protein D3C75_914810 [compost metagenome]
MRVSSAVSLAKSVSLMRLRDEDRFSDEVCRLATTEVKRFWIAPKSARVLLIEPNALSTISRACCAPLTLVTSRLWTTLLVPVAAAVVVAAVKPEPVMVPPTTRSFSALTELSTT